MLLKTKLFRYLPFFFLLVSAQHIGKGLASAECGLGTLENSQTFCRKRNPFLRSSASSLTVMLVFLLLFLLSSLCLHCFFELLGTEIFFLLPFTIVQHPLCLGYVTQIIYDNGFENVYLSPRAI